MDTLTHLLLLSLFSWTRSEPLGEALRRRSDGYAAYARDYAQDYEPYAFAAIPLHAPLPILHILSPMPLTPTNKQKHAASAHRSMYARPPYDNDYANSDYEVVYGESQTVTEPQKFTYAASYSRPQYQASDPSSESAEAPTILYARPTAQGGYIYRKRPNGSRTPPKKNSLKEGPIILRIHKYKFVKDDR